MPQEKRKTRSPGTLIKYTFLREIPSLLPFFGSTVLHFYGDLRFMKRFHLYLNALQSY